MKSLLLSMRRKIPFKIDIPVPCTQSWDNMSPMGNGRHCGHCSKTIIDFTQLADHEVVKIFMDSKVPVCGRFSEGQLNRDLLLLEKERANSIVPALLLSTALTAGIASNAIASNHRPEGMLHTEQMVTTGMPIAPAVSNKQDKDTTGLPAIARPAELSDTTNGIDQGVVVTALSVHREPRAAFMGFTVTTLPETKREKRRVERRARRVISKAARSKPVRITVPPTANDPEK